MDDVDLAILASFARDPRAAYGEVGSRVGLSGNAVRARLDRMARDGALQGFVALPDPALLGLSEGLLVFAHVEDIADREEEVLRSLPDVPGVLFADASVDQTVVAHVLHRDEADFERIERAAISLVGKPPALRLMGAPAPAAPAPSPADWRVLRALLPDARASLRDLSARSGLSFKTIQRRLGALLRDGRARCVPVLSGARARGAVLARLVGVPREGAALDEALRSAQPALAWRAAPGGLVTVDLLRPSLREAQEAARALRATGAFESLHLVLGVRRRFAGWLDEAVAGRLASPPASMPAAPLPVPRAPR